MSLTSADSLGEIEWIPRPRSTQLRRLGLETVGDLLTHYPRRYEDRREFAGFPREASEQPVCLCGEVVKTRLNRFGRRKIFEATLQEDGAHALSQPLILRWFNLHYVQKMILTGQRLVVFGKPRLRGQRLCLEHPEFEVIENDDEISIHFRRITPIYPATEGLSQRVLRGLIYRLLEEWEEDDGRTLLPSEIDATQSPRARHEIHFPSSEEDLARARETLVLAEFFAIQMLLSSRRARSRARSGAIHCGPGELLERFLRALPFDLTNAQARVIEELRGDLRSSIPMNRLLQGDVGSGKTVVAIAAMLLAVEAGFQAALMAPTQILAEQHYEVLRRWLEPLGVPVSLRTGARKEDPLPLFANAQARTPGSTGCQPVVPESLSGTSASQIRYGKRNLPHFERPWAKYAVTFSTRKKRELSTAARDIVLESLLHWNEERYTLYAACVMPDHVHLLFEPAIKETSGGETVFFSLREIFHSIKSHTARVINKVAGTTGPVWEEEWFDRLIRSERDLQEKFDYVLRNPSDAGLERGEGRYPWIWFPGIPDRNTARGRRADCTPRRADSPCSPERKAPLGQIFVGTHALLYEPEGLENPGLVVIDEQHKFGVAQRGRLTTPDPAPDVLVMTATPIPRTLTMSLYGDLDVSTIDEMPADRGKIVTAARAEEKLPDVLAFLRRELEAGRQAYIVYPLIDESEKLEAKAASAEFEKWHERLGPFRCELLHGRIPAPEKQAIMERFRRGLTRVLISTTVIEVGVDVANATVMLIENAERFGLAQLHQLRGRIGRGEHKSYCILLRSDPSEETIAKLGVLEKTSNGFEVAEADWQLRGPGDLLGTAQSGLPALKLGNLRTDAKLMQRARRAASKIFRDDPLLEKPENQRFRPLVVEEVGKTFSHVS
ncbi:MAG: DEAD/DEAH box helicase [Verrucomicrobiota bacterium]|nr:DEAD/DEAH box helicase [Chthoniobacterales bacterium]MDQ3413557.1 DEAD/DEAH box helicase [Verrucomicrobiota bacterium]